MKRITTLVISLLLFSNSADSQIFTAGFKSLSLVDSARRYKPGAAVTDPLYYRPVDLDIWYPSQEVAERPLPFEELFKLFELRAGTYQSGSDYSGLTAELAQFYVAGLGLGTDGQRILKIKTNTYEGVSPLEEKKPVVLYMAGFNGMSYENYKVLEKLAQNGFVVVSISSVGRYPGDMTNEKEDMMEQVLDAEFALSYLNSDDQFAADVTQVGVLGCSWGGMGAAVLANRHPEIKAMASFDGTETHYFGNDENDPFVQEIYESGLLRPADEHIAYLYFESDNKLDEFVPTGEYNYFKKLDGEKYYLRFTNSVHEDYLSIPSMLNASPNSVKIYNGLEILTIGFFKKYLEKAGSFEKDWKEYLESEDAASVPFSLPVKVAEESLELRGKVTDKKTEEPLPYVNIGVLDRETGTVSDIEGNFELELDESYLQDTLRASMIGYTPIELAINEAVQIKPLVRLEMEEKVQELNEVTVLAKALKRRRLGNTTKSKFLSTGFGYEQLGAEMGIKVNIRKPTLVDSFKFHISYNRLSSKAIFRLNFYNVEKGRPGQNILNDNIFVTIEPNQVGRISVDLMPYDITLTEDVMVTLEWVDFVGEKDMEEAIYFSLALVGNPTYFKRASQAKFKRQQSLGIGFYLDVQY